MTKNRLNTKNMKNTMNIQNKTQQTQITNQTSFHAIKGKFLFVIMCRLRIKNQFSSINTQSHDFIKICFGS
jgi:hypothetical protein